MSEPVPDKHADKRTKAQKEGAKRLLEQERKRAKKTAKKKGP